MRSILFLWALAGSQLLWSQTDVVSRRISGPLVIDGLATEWPQPFPYYDAETRLQFALANDSHNLYICFKTADPLLQVKINQAGMETGIQQKGKTRRNAIVEFPFVLQGMEQDALVGPGTTKLPDIQLLRDYYLSDDSVLFTSGFNKLNGLQRRSGICAIKAALNWDSTQAMYIEYCIPLGELADPKDKNWAGKELLLKVDVHAPEKPGGETTANNNTGSGMTSPGIGTGSITNPNDPTNPGGLGRNANTTGPMGGMNPATASANPVTEADKFYMVKSFRQKFKLSLP
ncbi:MAG: hypothetical protein JNL57_09000 [Bacteroidetes bacterium]|nr:hypothetical protein [Bacteroidota bacterium]